jgi:GPI ethanolamine phosphate transferase 1
LGPGISRPTASQDSANSHDNYSIPLELKDYERKDIRQIDIAPLGAVLLGIPIPTNSEGVVPLNYLEGDSSVKAANIYANAEQICSSYVKREEEWIRNSVLAVFSTSFSAKIRAKLKSTRKEIEKEDYKKALEDSYDLISFCTEGISEYQVSEKTGILVIFSIAFVSWMCNSFVITFIQGNPDLKNFESSKNPKQLWLAVSIILFIYVWLMNSPWRYYVYMIFPVFFGFQIARHYQRIKEFVMKIVPQSAIWIVLLLINFLLMTKAFKGEKNILMYAIFFWGVLTAAENFTYRRLSAIWMTSICFLTFILSFDRIELPVNSVFIPG